MKKLIILLVLALFSCKTLKSNEPECNENEKFKETFFYHIDNIKNNITVSQDLKFRESLIFISNYAPVSTETLMNYARLYPSGIFEKDLVKWKEWYEKNKCKNIQFKSSYIIPDAYKIKKDSISK